MLVTFLTCPQQVHISVVKPIRGPHKQSKQKPGKNQNSIEDRDFTFKGFGPKPGLEE